MPAREIVMWVREKQYGVPVDTPVLGVDKFYIRLSESFTVQDEPVVGYIPYGGGRAIRAEAFSDTVRVGGTLRTVAYPAQLALLEWCGTLIDAGRTIPWVTIDPDEVMPPGDLPSASIYHAVQLATGAYKRTRYAGCKVSNWSLAFGADGDARKGLLDITIVGQKPYGNPWDTPAATDPDATEFPFPAEADYPTGPFLLSHTRTGTGSVTIGTDRTQLSGFTVSAANKLDVRYYNSRYADLIKFTGRDGRLESEIRLKAAEAVDDELAHRLVTALNAQITLDAGGVGKTVTIDFHGRNVLAAQTRNNPIDKEFSAKITLENMWDPAVATDLTITRS